MTSENMSSSKEVQTLMSVEFPGVVNNLERMMSMIGGHECLESVFNSCSSRLQLRFRPQDVYCHAVHGDRVAVQQILVKFRRKLVTYDDGSTEEVTEAETLGVLDSSYVFQSLCDFQYLPMKRIDSSESSQAEYVSIKDEVIPRDPFNPCLEDKNFNESSPMFILPTILSRFDSVMSDYLFKNGPDFRNPNFTDMLADQVSKQVIGSKIRRSRRVKSHDVSFKTCQDIPREVDEDTVNENKVFINKDLLAEVKECFAQKPIWTRSGLIYTLGCKESDLKYVLPIVAFKWTDGPFKHSWNRFGYDVKKDKKSRKFQTIDFRVKKTYKSIDSQNKRSEYQLPLLKSTRSVIGSSSSTEQDKEMRRVKYSGRVFFKPETIPSNRQLVYQLEDIDLQVVKDILSVEPEVKTIDEKEGWLPSRSYEIIRHAMTQSLDSIMKGAKDHDSNQESLKDLLEDEDLDEEDEDSDE